MTGSVNANPARKSVSPAPRSFSICSATSARTRGRSTSTLRGVNARLTRARTRVWYGWSFHTKNLDKNPNRAW